MISLQNKPLIISVFLLSFSALTFCQEVVLEKDLSKSIYYQKTGINHKYFGSFFADYASYVPSGKDQLQTLPLRSNNFSAGYRWNHRVYGNYSAGLSMYYFYDVLSLKQFSGKTFPTLSRHEKEKLQVHNLGIDLYQRITLKKEYNQTGYYFDAGAFGNFAFAKRYKAVDKNNDPEVSGKEKVTIIRAPGFLKPFGYGVFLRVGHNNFYILLRYRLNDWIKDESSVKQPQKLTAGIGVNLY